MTTKLNQGDNALEDKKMTHALVRCFTTAQLTELRRMADLLEEAGGNLRGLMDTQRAEELQVRELLPDELEGSAILLRDIANGFNT